MPNSYEQTGQNWWDTTQEKFFMYDFKTLQKLSNGDLPKNAEVMYDKVREAMGDKVQEQGSVLRPDAVEPNPLAIEKIYNQLPEVYNKMVVDKVTKLRTAFDEVELEKGKEVIDTLTDGIGEGNYKKSYEALETIKELYLFTSLK